MSDEAPVPALRRRLPDILACSLLVLASALVFGRHSGLLGFYADDPGFLRDVHPGLSIPQLFDLAMGYVTGRNLHMVWQYIITVLAGGRDVQNLAAMHHIQALGDCVNGVLVFATLRVWGFRRVGAFGAALAFALFPNHGETHFWLSALPMNIGSTFFVLLLLLVLGLLVGAVRCDDRPRAARIAVPLAVIFVCAMFTYDQVVPVVMASVCLVLLYVALRRPFRIPALLGLAAALAVFAGLVVWKVSDPAGGPALSRLSIGELVANVVLSVKIWVLALLFPLQTNGIGGIVAQVPAGADVLTRLFPMRVLASEVDGRIAAALALLAALLVYWLARKEEPPVRSAPAAAPVPLPAWALLGAGVGLFLLGYLPGYIWFISPRHSYLPSVGVAALLAALISAIPVHLLRRRAVAAVLAAFFGLEIAGYSLSNQVEKEYWIESYALRKQVYEELGAKFRGPSPTDLLLAGFPASPRPSGPALAFLTGEHRDAVSIVTRGRVTARAIHLHPVPAREGYFVRTEESRWGGEAFVYLPKEQATVVVFQGRSNARLAFAYDDKRSLFRQEVFYSLAPVPGTAAGGELRFAARAVEEGFDLTIPAVPLAAGEALAVVACHTADGHRTPVYYQRRDDNERFLVPVEVPAAGTAGAVLRLQYRIPLQGIDCFRLYKVGRDKPEPIAEAAAL